MDVKKIEFIGEVCDCDNSSNLTTCRTGMSDACISSQHKGFEMIVVRMWVESQHFVHPLKKLLEAGKYRVVIEKIEDTDAG